MDFDFGRDACWCRSLSSHLTTPLYYIHTHTTRHEQAGACAVIHLQGTSVDEAATPYAFEDEVLIHPGSRVVLQGTAAALPLLDCSRAIRCFRVLVRYTTHARTPGGVGMPDTPA